VAPRIFVCVYDMQGLGGVYGVGGEPVPVCQYICKSN